MKRPILLLAAMCICIVARSQTWTLIWSDEFNGTTLDQSKWNYEIGTGVNGDFGTGQLDRATERTENVGIEQGITGADGGALRITTRKEFYIDRNYTSGRINSKAKAGWGPNHRIVARVWPRDVRTMGQGFAFWLMPNEVPQGQTDISWPQGGEVDIMEYVGSIPSHNLGSNHYAWAWNNNQYADWNHGYQGGYYSFADAQVPDSPEWIRVDLGSLQNVTRVLLNWENTGKSFKIQTSTDGTSWSDAYSTTAGDGGIDDISFAARSARFVRMYGTQRSNDWGYSIYDFQVFAGSATNIASGKPATASSSQGTDVGTENAFDNSTTTRWSSRLRNPDYQCCAQSSTTDASVAANGWHTYGINWYSDRMEFFVDDNVYHIHYFNDGAAFAADGENQAEVQIVNGKRVRKTEFSNLFSEWHPFEHKMYAILSAGVGGGGQTYGGPIVNEAVFPCNVYVDWVRVYSNGQVFNPPPQVTLTAPTGTETYPAPASITLNASASDLEGGTIASVSFYNGTALLGIDNAAPFSYTWNNVPAGNYSISAKATDNGGATANSNSVNIAVNGPSSNLALNRPGTASSVTGSFAASLAFDASATTRWESAYTDPQWIYVDLGNTYTINRVKITWETAMAKDYVVEISNNTTGPWTQIKSVIGNAATVNDLTGLSGSGRYVRIYGTARTTAYGYSILSAEVYGSGGTTNNPPVVSVTAPANNATYTAPASINITANASDTGGSITKVEFFNGATLLGADTSSPYSFSWTNVAAGTYTITAKATDNGGASTVSAGVNVIVNNSTNPNLALNKTATASTVMGAYVANNATDGVTTSRWESAYADPQWIYVDLGASYTVNRVKITWENAYGKDYQIQISDSPTAGYANMRTITGNTALVNDQTGLSGIGRYVRIYGTARGTGWGYSIFEFEVYGSGGTSGATIPGTIQAESYSAMSGVQTETTTDTGGGSNVGYVDASDWMDYNVTVNSAGTYAVQFRVAGWNTAAQLQLKKGTAVLATVNVPNTGGGQVWGTATANVALTAGAQTLRVQVVTGGFNFNWMSFALSGARVGFTETALEENELKGFPNPVTDLLHIKGVADGSPVGVLDLSGKVIFKTKVENQSVNMSSLNKGVYIVQVQQGKRLLRMKVMKK